MKAEYRIETRTEARLFVGPVMQTRLTVLASSRSELREAMMTELEENPVLEDENLDLIDDLEQDPEAGGDVGDLVDRIEAIAGRELQRGNANTREEYPDRSKEAAAEVSLYDHLIAQVALRDCTRALREQTIELIGDVNPDGYLDTTEARQGIATHESSTVDPPLALLQSLEPAGVGARDLVECLRLQLDRREQMGSIADKVLDHPSLVSEHRYAELSQVLGTDLEAVKAGLKMLGQLDPTPGRRFSPSGASGITPDVRVLRLDDGEFVVLPNDSGMPRLRIGTAYRKMALTDSPEVRNYLAGKIQAARCLIRSVADRQKTVLRVVRSIVDFQYEFFVEGITHLQPLRQRDVAEDIGLCDSTVSRAIQGKYIQTDRGVFAMKFFFQPELPGGIARERAVRFLREIVSSESPETPMTDDAIRGVLNRSGIHVARRTVQKLRGELGIPDSATRRRLGVLRPSGHGGPRPKPQPSCLPILTEP